MLIGFLIGLLVVLALAIWGYSDIKKVMDDFKKMGFTPKFKPNWFEMGIRYGFIMALFTLIGTIIERFF